jgi:hypothetical protein
MTDIAIIRGCNVGGALATSSCAIVTADTSTDHLRVVNRRRCNRCPGSREFLMAGIAQIRGINVRGTLTCRIRAVMTIDTVIHKAAVINDGRCPVRGDMTGIALLGRLKMRCTLTRCNCAIMTGRTSACYLIMIDTSRRNRLPWRGARRMTGRTIIS